MSEPFGQHILVSEVPTRVQVGVFVVRSKPCAALFGFSSATG